MRELSQGRLRMDLIDPFPQPDLTRPTFRSFYDGLRRLLEEQVDPQRIDETGEYPPEVLEGPLAGHVRWAARTAGKLARAVFHGMLRHGPGLEHRQAFLFRAVDVAVELFAMSAAVSRARRLATPEAHELADLFARGARRRVDDLLRALWRNDDALTTRVGRRVLAGAHTAVEEGGMGLPYTVDELRPPSMDDLLAAPDQPRREPRDRWTRRLARQPAPGARPGPTSGQPSGQTARTSSGGGAA